MKTFVVVTLIIAAVVSSSAQVAGTGSAIDSLVSAIDGTKAAVDASTQVVAAKVADVQAKVDELKLTSGLPVVLYGIVDLVSNFLRNSFNAYLSILHSIIGLHDEIINLVSTLWGLIYKAVESLLTAVGVPSSTIDDIFQSVVATEGAIIAAYEAHEHTAIDVLRDFVNTFESNMDSIINLLGNLDLDIVGGLIQSGSNIALSAFSAVGEIIVLKVILTTQFVEILNNLLDKVTVELALV